MLSKTVSPKTKAELIRALQAASIRSFDIFEGDQLGQLPSFSSLKRSGATIVVIR